MAEALPRLSVIYSEDPGSRHLPGSVHFSQVTQLPPLGIHKAQYLQSLVPLVCSPFISRVNLGQHVCPTPNSCPYISNRVRFYVICEFHPAALLHPK